LKYTKQEENSDRPNGLRYEAVAGRLLAMCFSG
jgi:hypothetical protein